MMNLRKEVYHIVDENNRESLLSRIFNIFIISLIVLNVISIIIESFEKIYLAHKNEFYVFEVVSVIIFTIEYLLRLWTAKLKYPEKGEFQSLIKYFFSFFAIIDLLAILPFYLPFLIPIDLRFIRILRILRVTRVFKLGRYSKSLKLIGEVFKDKKADLLITLFVTFILLVLASTLMYYIEHEIQPEAFPNIVASFWWAIATLTTVGYGDVYPLTPWGKVISSIIALLGIGLVALPTGILSASFLDKMKNNKIKNSDECKENITCPHCGNKINLSSKISQK